MLIPAFTISRIPVDTLSEDLDLWQFQRRSNNLSSGARGSKHIGLR